MEILKKIFHGKGYIDGITIINLEGEILFTAKLNGKLSNKDEPYEVVGKNFLDVYENLTPGNSTLLKAMELGMPVYVENQQLKSKGKKDIRITSLSLPIKSGNRVVGAIDLSTEETRASSAGGGKGGTGREGAGRDGAGTRNTGGDKTEKDGTERRSAGGGREGEENDLPLDLTAEDLSDGGTHRLEGRSAASFTLSDIIAVDGKMKKVKDYIEVVAACDLPVMIYGETGTGKEMFAQAIHNAGGRRQKPFIAQNCAAIPDTLLESILFGTSRGAFTGAVENKGLFELADGGTLFLDELNAMPLYLQSKLLRVLQDGSFRSLGSKTTKEVDVRLIAALNVEPQAAISQGLLRRDIYYRLSMMSITIPPLRERRKDIACFVKTYVKKHNVTFRKQIRYVSRELIRKLEAYDWPGNVRELEHTIVYGMSVVAPDSTTLEFKDIQDKYAEMQAAAVLRQPAASGAEAEHAEALEADGPEAEDMSMAKEGVACASLRDAVDAYEKELIGRALAVTEGNVSQAARILDVPRQTLQRKAKQYGLG